jgi:phosphohistidine phosphatase
MATTLVLIRHAKRQPGFPDNDDLCPISAEGKLLTQRLTSLLEEAKISPYRILYSPTVRTRETAEILGVHFQVLPEENVHLSLWADPSKLLPILPDPKEERTLFLVSHGPTLLSFAEKLVAGPIGVDMATSSALILRFPKKIEAGQAEIVGYLASPRK